MQTVSLSDFQNQCIVLLKQVEKIGESLIVTEDGHPVVRIMPYDESSIEKYTKELLAMLRSILVMDDLDCNDAKTREKFFFDAIDSIPETADIMKQVGFAAPEIESWLIADWENTFAKDVDFRGRHENMRWWLSNKGISFGNPESFSKLCPERNSYEEKLSELIIESSQRDEGKERFSI